MTIEHRLKIELTVTAYDADGNAVDVEERELNDGQVTAFRELCDECYVETRCGDGDGCAFYEDRVFRGVPR